MSLPQVIIDEPSKKVYSEKGAEYIFEEQINQECLCCNEIELLAFLPV